MVYGMFLLQPMGTAVVPAAEVPVQADAGVAALINDIRNFIYSDYIRVRPLNPFSSFSSSIFADHYYSIDLI